MTGSPTPSSTKTGTPTATATCILFSDNFSSSNSLNNYNYFFAGNQAVTTASGAGYAVSGNTLQNTHNGGLAVLTSTNYNPALTSYTIQADFEMDSYAGGSGLFGLAFYTGNNGSFYSFQWNGDALTASGSPNWEVEKNTGSPSVSFTYPGGGVQSPAYVLGSTVHMKVVVNGNNFMCYVNLNDGVGDRLIMNVTDSSSPYTSGPVGIRTYGTTSPNVIRVSNFTVSSCAAVPTATFTPTLSPTVTSTSTITNTLPPTATWTGTSTPTATCVIFSDNFSSSNSLNNYNYFQSGNQVSSTASVLGFTVANNTLVDGPLGGLAVLTSTNYNPALTSYTIQADFEMDSYQGNLGLFGLAFYTGSNGSFYSFQWNGDAGNANGGIPDWEIEKNTGSPTVTFTYLASKTIAPAYVLGSTIHLKVVVNGNNFMCYANMNDGVGDRLIYNVTDTSSPYTSGPVGIRTYGINSPNLIRIQNLTVSSCAAVPTPTSTLTPTVTSTPTTTSTLPPTATWTGTSTPTATCILFSDNFSSSNSLNNYNYFFAGTQGVTTASGAGYAVVSNTLQDTHNGGLAVLTSTNYNPALTSYTLEGDFEMDSYAGNSGLFGLAFYTGSNGSFYSFHWNGNFSTSMGSTKCWEIEKNTGSPSVSFTYPGTGQSSPVYTLGTTIHMKVVVNGNNFMCYVNMNDGVGDRLIYNVTDTSSPYTSGPVGIRTYGTTSPNVIRVSNFTVSSCAAIPTATFTPTATTTSTPTITSSPTPEQTCTSVIYTDNFSTNTLANYLYYFAGNQAVTTATGAGYTITGGTLEDTLDGGLAVLNSSYFNPNTTNFSIQADFEMDSVAGGNGAFGLAFYTGSNGSFYSFQWNNDGANADGGTPDWEIEKNTGSPSVSYTYPASGTTTPAYVLGTTIHLKVVVNGDNFICYANLNDGAGDRLIYNVTDTNSPYTSGPAGIRTYGIGNPNVVRINNLAVNGGP
jgi:hypothetical protein